MKEFFQRLIDSVAELSTQASKVDGLSNQVNSLNDRLNQLEQANRELNQRVVEAETISANMQRELENTNRNLESEKAVSQSLRETIIQRDAGVQTLEANFRQEQDAHKITTSERDDARLRVNELESEVERHNRHINDLSTDRDTWRSLATDHERELNQVKQQLEKVNSILNPLRVVSSDVA
jgi:chromosome segregation ATPase